MQLKWTWPLSLVSFGALFAACSSSAPATTHPILDVQDTSLTFFAEPGEEDDEADVTVDDIYDDGDGSLAPPTATVQYKSGNGWLDVSVHGTKAPYAITVKPSAKSLPVGTHTATIRVDSPGAANSPQEITATMKVSTTPVRTLTGVVTYEKVLPTANGLDYDGATWEKVRGARVSLVDVTTNKAIRHELTDSSGRYKLELEQDVTLVKVTVDAATVTPMIRVQDNTQGGALYVAVPRSPFDAGKGSVYDVKIASGWDKANKKYVSDSERAAAPFAILDAVYSAASKFLAERPSIKFENLTVNWSTQNRKERKGEKEDLSKGIIGSSHWSPTQEALFILGLEDEDTDEYDSHVIVHEWGHYFENKMSRSDSPGGTHDLGDAKDPRLAWGEGWATALGGIVFHPRTEYIDTNGPNQSKVGPSFDIELNEDGDTRNPGWFSEMSVLHIFYDLWDPPRVDLKKPDESSFDNVQVTLGDLYDVMVTDQKTTPAFTTLFSFIDALKRRKPQQAVAIDALLAHRSIVKNRVTDAYGTNEKNNGNGGKFPLVYLPVYHELKIDGPDTQLKFIGAGTDPETVETNSLGTTRLAYFTAGGADKGAFLNVKTQGVGVRFAVQESGTNGGWSAGAVPGDRYTEAPNKGEFKPSTKSACEGMQLKPGSTYRVVIVSTDDATKEFTATATLSSKSCSP